ncbi:MAG TPA: HEAT repeat domain-containing protein [Anaeromyxobacteraceae bacterium]|nr:HEAT repeat domain-containing protein [Anaeromyxobacteraceae bacterium]
MSSPLELPESDVNGEEGSTDLRLVGQLEDLRRGPLAFFDLVRRGPRVAPLVEALLHGPSRSISQPRRLAAEVLGTLGSGAAAGALLRALEDSSSRSLPPALRLAEDEVVDSIARQLERFPGPDTDRALLEALRRHPYPACLQALGRRRYAPALPRIVECLHDDFARTAAAEALRAFGDRAEPELARAVQPLEGGDESPTHVAGRRTAVSLLAEVGGPEVENILRQALEDPQRSIRVSAALGLQARGRPLSDIGVQALVESLGEPDWTIGELAASALAVVDPPGIDTLERAARDSGAEPDVRRRRYRALRLLLRIMPGSAAGLVPPLLTDPDPRVRRAGVELLIETSEPRVTLLVACLGDVDPVVRSLATRALRSMGILVGQALQRAISRDVPPAPHRSRLRACWHAWGLARRSPVAGRKGSA